MCVLVVDMFEYGHHNRRDALEQWLEILQFRLPGAVVLLVGTHKDSFADPVDCESRVRSFKEGGSHHRWSRDLYSWFPPY